MTAWQGSDKGKEKKPYFVLTALSDYHLWFWYDAYGYADMMNDILIFDISPLFKKLLDGTFKILLKLKLMLCRICAMCASVVANAVGPTVATHFGGSHSGGRPVLDGAIG
jgi:hypothetical protein